MVGEANRDKAGEREAEITIAANIAWARAVLDATLPPERLSRIFGQGFSIQKGGNLPRIAILQDTISSIRADFQQLHADEILDEMRGDWRGHELEYDRVGPVQGMPPPLRGMPYRHRQCRHPGHKGTAITDTPGGWFS